MWSATAPVLSSLDTPISLFFRNARVLQVHDVQHNAQLAPLENWGLLTP